MERAFHPLLHKTRLRRAGISAQSQSWEEENRLGLQEVSYSRFYSLQKIILALEEEIPNTRQQQRLWRRWDEAPGRLGNAHQLQDPPCGCSAWCFLIWWGCTGLPDTFTFLNSAISIFLSCSAEERDKLQKVHKHIAGKRYLSPNSELGISDPCPQQLNKRRIDWVRLSILKALMDDRDYPGDMKLSPTAPLPYIIMYLNLGQRRGGLLPLG